MAEYLVQGESLTAVADAIREKIGSGDLVFPAGFVEAIQSIKAGGDRTQVLVEAMVTLSSTVSSTARTIYTDKEGRLTDGTKCHALFLPATATGNSNVLGIVASPLLPYNLVYYKTTASSNQATCSSSATDMLIVADGSVKVCSKLSSYPIAKGDYLLLVIG